MGMALLAIFKVDGQNQTVNAMLVSMASVVGLALLFHCRTWWQVTDSCAELPEEEAAQCRQQDAEAEEWGLYEGSLIGFWVIHK